MLPWFTRDSGRFALHPAGQVELPELQAKPGVWHAQIDVFDARECISRYGAAEGASRTFRFGKMAIDSTRGETHVPAPHHLLQGGAVW